MTELSERFQKWRRLQGMKKPWRFMHPKPRRIMREGKLNKEELAQVARCYATISALIEKLPKAEMSSLEADTLDRLLAARNPLGVLMRGQDFGGVWKQFTS